MTAHALDAVAQPVDRAVIDRLFDRCILDPSTRCLLWTGYTNKDGHGQLRVGRKVVVVSRLMWELTNHRPIPPGFIVRHRCDDPRCCEPTHLEVGTHEDNVADRVERGRSACGTRNGRSKLTIDSVRAIRRRCHEPVGVLAREFGVDPRAIRAVLAGETWKDA
jgi:HNH endonuclease